MLAIEPPLTRVGLKSEEPAAETTVHIHAGMEEELKSMSSSTIITPGETVAEAADWSPGEGVTQNGDSLVAVTTGNVSFDEEQKTVSVSPSNEGPLDIKVGDMVIAEIGKIRESMLEARILHVEGKEGRDPLPQQLFGNMHVTKMVDRYLHNAGDGVCRRDVIRAKVIETDPVVRLDMRNDDDCGVLHALCPQCGMALEPYEHEDWNVSCGDCGYIAFRALSKSFGLGYNPSEQGAKNPNNPGKRWGREAEQRFTQGPSARSNLIAADHRNDGTKVEHFRFEGTGGGGGGGGRGRPERPKGRKLFVGGLSQGVSDDDLLEAFEKFGKVVDHIVMKDRETGRNRGFGFVTFSEDNDGDKAIKGLNKQNFMGRTLTVNDAGEKKESGAGGGGRKQAEGTRLYVGGLPWKVNNEQLTKVFSEHGQVNDCHIVMDGERSKGFGFVTVSDDSADKVIAELDGFSLEGRRLKVQKAKSGGGGRGGGTSPRGGRDDDRSNRSSREQQARKEEGVKD